LVEEGVRGVVVADLDAEGHKRSPATSARALAVGCDVAVEAQVTDVIARAQDASGPIDSSRERGVAIAPT
jgi:hypothetical protein